MQFVVLFGPQAGANVTLYSGGYTIGCGEDDDVVVMGRGVVDAHFRFEIDETTGRLTVGECAKTVFSEGANALLEGDEIRLSQKFWIGNVVIGIGDLETRWDEPKFEDSPYAVDPSIGAADLGQASLRRATSQEPADDPSSHNALNLDTDLSNAAGPVSGEISDTNPLGQKRKSSRSAILIPIIVTTVAVLGGLGIVLVAGNDESPAMTDQGQILVSGQEEFAEIKALLAGISGVSDVKATLIDGVPHVVGFAPTTQTIDMISTAILGIAPDAKISVIADSELEKRAVSVLSGRDVKVSKVEDGIVYVRSVVSDPGAKEQLVAFVKEELAGAAGVNAKEIYDIRELIDVFGDQLRRHGISRVSLRSLRDEVIVSGRIQWSQLDALEDLMSGWKNEYGLTFREANPVVLDGNNVPFDLVAAVGGDNGFVLLSGQKKVHVGGEVATGFTLKSVADGALVIARNGSDYMIDIRETE